MNQNGQNALGYIMFGAVIGAVATVMYYNQGEELCRVGRWVSDRSRRAVDNVADMAEERESSVNVRRRE